MSYLTRKLMIVMVVGVLLPARLFAATEIHIAPAPAGDDGNPGTVAQPVATPQAAQTLVRSLITAGLTDVVDVIFAAGTYHLATPLELRPEDSGTATFPITWKAAASATVVLSGGKPITATWIDGGSGICGAAAAVAACGRGIENGADVCPGRTTWWDKDASGQGGNTSMLFLAADSAARTKACPDHGLTGSGTRSSTLAPPRTPPSSPAGHPDPPDCATGKGGNGTGIEAS